jgi:hypothetical protein
VADPSPSPSPAVAAAGIAAGAGDQYEVVAQACAMAVADAVAYLRNTEIIASAVVGVAMERLVLGFDASAALAAIEAAQNSVLAAARTLDTVGQSAAHALLSFPGDANPDAAPA